MTDEAPTRSLRARVGHITAGPVGHLSHRATALVARTRARLDRHPRLDAAVDLIRRIIRRQGRVRVSLLAAGVAFWLIIGSVPTLIAVVMILGLVLDPDQVQETLSTLEDATPGSFGVTVLRQVQSAAEAEDSSLSIGFAISLAVVAYATSTAAYNLSRGIRSAYDLPPRVYLKARALAFGTGLLGILGLAIVTAAVAVVAAWAGSLRGTVQAGAYIGLVLAGLALLTGVLAWQFRFAIGRVPRGERRPPIAAGAAGGAIGILGVFIGFGIYLGFSQSFESTYGALAGTIIAMMVLYASCYAILLGAVLNAELRPAR